MSAKLVPTFEDRGYYMVGVTDPYGRILGFLKFKVMTLWFTLLHYNLMLFMRG
jgi:hypothetical protein